MNATNITGRISISRSANRGLISIIVRDELSRTKFLEIEMGLEDFAAAVTGMGEVLCQMRTRHLERVGLQMQTKIVHIELRPEPFALLLLEHETDGWKGNIDDLTNLKRRVGHNVQAVTFSRWIATEDIKPCPKP